MKRPSLGHALPVREQEFTYEPGFEVSCKRVLLFFDWAGDDN
jgi:hypothetical protein